MIEILSEGSLGIDRCAKDFSVKSILLTALLLDKKRYGRRGKAKGGDCRLTDELLAYRGWLFPGNQAYNRFAVTVRGKRDWGFVMHADAFSVVFLFLTSAWPL